MPNSPRVPGWIRALFALLVPGEIREEAVGDLREGYLRVFQQRGRLAAHLWAFRQLLALRPGQLRRAVNADADLDRDDPVGRSRRGTLGWRTDLKHATRSIAARPGASATVIVTIAVALGLTTSVFSVVRGVLLNPLPYPDSEELVRIWQVHRGWLDSENVQLRSFAERFPLSMPTFNDWTDADFGVESLGAYTGAQFVNQGSDGAEIIPGQYVTSGFLETLGVQPMLGRSLLPEDDVIGAPRVAVLTHGFWRDRYDGDRDVLGSTLTLDGEAYTIVGVLPPEFRPTTGDARILAPMPEETKVDERDSQYLQVVARLAPGTTIESASARLADVQVELSRVYPDEQGEIGARMVSLLDSIVGNVKSTLWFLLAAVGLVLAIASANIANILSVLGLTRRREMSVKAALGAGRSRLVRGLFIEVLLLCLLGGLAGLLLATLTLPLLLAVVPASVPRYDEIGLDAGVLLFGLGLTAATALLVGVLPGLQAAQTDPNDMIRSAGRGLAGERSGSRVRSVLVSAEVALAFVLLVGAGLLGSSFAKLWAVERGFATENLIVVRSEPDPLVYPESEDRDRFVSDLRRELDAIPGAVVSATNQVPLSGTMSTTTYEFERDAGPVEEGNLVINVVLENYFDVMQIPLIEGRGLEPTDVFEAPLVGVVGEKLANDMWPGESAIGKRIRSNEDNPWTTIVGVVGDVRHSGLDDEVNRSLYVTVWQNHRHPQQWVLRARGDMGGVIDLAREAVGKVSPSTPVRSAMLLESSIEESVAVPRFRALFVVGLAGMAGFLALLGVYGVVTFAVTQRTREIGVRMALGARQDSVVRSVVGSGLKLAAFGVVIGLAIALGLAGVVSDFLFETEATDPVTYTAIAALVALVSAGAAYLPARRAAAIDPMRVLNSD